MDNLYDQMSQLMKMFQKQNGQSLPSNTKHNPRRDGKEHVKAITLRSKKELKLSSMPIHKEEEGPEAVDKPTKRRKLITISQSMRRDEADFVSSLNLFKSLNPNSLLLELIDKIPKYVKHLKEIMKQHRKIKNSEQIDISDSCSALIAKRISPKVKDSGSFTIPMELGDQNFSKALCNLGASINLMPLLIYRKLILGDLKNALIMLQLADKSFVHPKGVLEDVLVKVRGFIFPLIL
ncbi:gag-asp_proteas domain-containing protein [Gossypium australe]|uniref:Gag-asp_proteas domain-containing protein n=1 Tax=Gossypium australe TaxID=47621 RepID=A0A5B6VNX9_9ROSI|nr:gag-asp_proteas domain-containing protein [Gossypium australe]